MNTIMDKLGAAIDEYQNKKHPFFRRQIAAAFAVVENGKQIIMLAGQTITHVITRSLVVAIPSLILLTTFVDITGNKASRS